MGLNLIHPDWPVPDHVQAFSTTRSGGFSKNPWNSLNLGLNCGDDTGSVLRNRELLGALMPNSPQWLRQVHGMKVNVHSGPICADLEGDAVLSRSIGNVCAILTADCLPVFFCNRSGTEVAAAHAGWRGLASGVLEETVRSMHSSPEDLMAWLGPAIGPGAYEVGADVKAAFGQRYSACFKKNGGRWLFDLYEAARIRLTDVGVAAVYGGEFCTLTQQDLFFSYRRDGQTGRMAHLIWMSG